MPIASLRFQFRQPFRAPADVAFRWCTDFGPEDASLMHGTRSRAVRWIAPNALVLTDVTAPNGHRRVIHRLVRIDPSTLSWTNTHVDGPFRHSQYWYRVVPDGSRSSHLEFTGLRLVRVRAQLSPAEIRRRADAERTADSALWRGSLAPALEAAAGTGRG